MKDKLIYFLSCFRDCIVQNESRVRQSRMKESVLLHEPASVRRLMRDLGLMCYLLYIDYIGHNHIGVCMILDIGGTCSEVLVLISH